MVRGIPLLANHRGKLIGLLRTSHVRRGYRVTDCTFIPTALLDAACDTDADRAKREALASLISYHRCVQELQRSRPSVMRSILRAFFRHPLRSVWMVGWRVYGLLVTLLLGDGLVDQGISIEQLVEQLRTRIVAHWLAMLDCVMVRGGTRISTSLFPDSIEDAGKAIARDACEGAIDAQGASALLGELTSRVRIALSHAPHQEIYLPNGMVLVRDGHDRDLLLERRSAPSPLRLVR